MSNMNQRPAHTSDHFQRPSGHTSAMASRSQSFDRRTRAEGESSSRLMCRHSDALHLSLRMSLHSIDNIIHDGVLLPSKLSVG